MLTFYFSGAEGTMTEAESLTSGMVGKELQLEFSPEWDGLSKTVVFSNGQVTVDVPFTRNPVIIPAKILEKPLKKLLLGVYGVSLGGTLVIPTVRTEGPRILPGVEPSEDSATDPTLPIWAEILTLMGDMANLETHNQLTLVDAINEVAAMGGGEAGADGATFTPAVSEEGILSWTNDQGLENPDPVNIMGPQGEPGPAGAQGETGPAGAQGPAGQDGYSPVRGVDYWTEDDQATIKSYVDEAILGGAW